MFCLTTQSISTAPKTSPTALRKPFSSGEAATNFHPWGDPLNVRDPRLGQNEHPDGFGCPGRKPQFGMADGSVRTFDPKEFAELLDEIP